MRTQPLLSIGPNTVRAGAALLGASVLIFLPACHDAGRSSLAELPTPAAPAASPSNLIEVRSSFFVGPESFRFPGEAASPAGGEPPSPQVLGIYSAAEGEKIRDRLARKGYLIEGTHISASHPNQPQSVELVRNHTFASEYAPAVKGEPSPDDGMFPVTPATPTEFLHRELGIRANYRGHAAHGGSIDLDLWIKRATLVGSINHGEPITFQGTGWFGRPVTVVIAENRIEMPLFSERSLTEKVRVNHGDFIAIGGFPKVHPEPGAGPFVAPPANLGIAENGNFFCLIQVLWAAPPTKIPPTGTVRETEGLSIGR